MASSATARGNPVARRMSSARCNEGRGRRANDSPPFPAACGNTSGGGGGGAKLGVVRVGLSLLAMGDFALASRRSPGIPSAATPTRVPSSTAGFRHRGGGRAEHAANQITKRRAMGNRGSATTMKATTPPPSTPVTLLTPTNGASASGASGTSGAATGAYGSASTNGAAPGVRADSGTVKSVVAPRTVNGVKSVVAVGGTKRLGVLRPAEMGSSRARKIKVKGLYARARKILRSSSPSASETAAAILEEALTVDPQDGHSWLLLARTREAMGDVNAASDVFKRAVVECPGNAHLWQSWGMLQAKFGDCAKARISFSNGLEADPGRMRYSSPTFLPSYSQGSRQSVAISQALAELLATHGQVEEGRGLLQKAMDRLEKAASARSKRSGGEGSPDPSAAWAAAGDRPKKRSAEEAEDSDQGLTALLMAWANFEESRGNEKRALELMAKAMENEPDNARARVGRARFEMRRGNMRDARIFLSEAANLPQEDGTLFSMWATLEIKEGNLETALKIAEAATARFPWDKFLLQTMGTVHGKLGRYEEAIECYRRSIALSPAAPAYVAWALVVAKLAERAERNASSKETAAGQEQDVVAGDPVVEYVGDASDDGTILGEASDAVAGGSGGTAAENDGGAAGEGGVSRTEEEEGPPSYEEARRLFELGILADPTHGPLYNAYGSMEAKLGNVEHARSVYKRGIAARCSGAVHVWQGFGKLEASEGNRDAARKARPTIFARGIRESSEDVSFLCHSLGSLELAADRLGEARAVFLAGVERYPNGSQLLLGAGLAIAKMGEPDNAREYFRRSVEADPSHAHAWQAWGLMETRAGNFKVARSLWERGLKANPTHGPLWQAYAVMEEKVGEPERARKLFEAGLERCPDHVQLHQAWAVMEGMSGDLKRARELVVEGLRLDPHHGALWTVYSIVERQGGSDVKARKVLELGVRACPDHGPLHRCWAQMEHQLGNTAEARRRFERGLEACPTYARLYYAYADMEAAMGNTVFVEKLKARGEKALVESGAAPDKIKEFQQQMEAFKSFARFDATFSSERMATSLDHSSLEEFDFDW
ncbi:unnamed protein product [Ectocarpus sp. CCAP 1310/34]|nr:unnamed protein product [Ectocarpus sp. CCAP 1310/34]